MSGQNKAAVLINRIDLFWGTDWQAVPNHFHAKSFDRNRDRCPDVVIGCVDTRAARRAIEGSLSHALNPTCYWLDLGNNAASGQYVLGQPLNTRNRRKAERLRTVSELYPEIVDAEAVKIHYQVVQQSRHSTGRNRLSIRRSPRARWRRWRSSCDTEGSRITERSSTRRPARRVRCLSIAQWQTARRRARKKHSH